MSEKEIQEDKEPGTPKSTEENKPEPEEPEEEKPPPVDPVEDKAKLKDLIKSSLSQISQTADNSGFFNNNNDTIFSSCFIIGFAFVKLAMPEKEITSLYDLISNYPHLRYLNLSSNRIDNISSIACLKYLIYLDVSKNKITDISFLSEKVFFFLLLVKNKMSFNFFRGCYLFCNLLIFLRIK
jgi:Leucine-rich repeat (LRR) protein